MIDQQKMKELFTELNEKLKTKGEIGEIGLVGGAVMCLVFQARKATKDIDAIFEPAQTIRQISAEMGNAHGLGENWLNDAAKGFIQGNFKKQDIFQFSHLRIWAPEPEYMLAMKCISARWDSHDLDDVKLLTQKLQLKTPEEAFRIIKDYYPKKQIPARTQLMLEELFED